MSPGSLSFVKLVMMSSAPAKSAGDARHKFLDTRPTIHSLNRRYFFLSSFIFYFFPSGPQCKLLGLPVIVLANKVYLFIHHCPVQSRLHSVLRVCSFNVVRNRPFYSCGSVTRPINGSEAVGDLVLKQTSLLFLCKCRLVSITTTRFT